MKHLKSSGHDLRTLFSNRITARDVAEALVSFDAEQPVGLVAHFMEQRDFDAVGVRQHGSVTGYVLREGLGGGTVADNMVIFGQAPNDGLILSDTTPLLDVLQALAATPRAFVSILGQVGGIVTRGDLQKAPVRMYLFGLVSLVEMQLLRIIRESYTEEQWLASLTDGRLEKAREILRDRQKRNEAIDLADCLQFADKVTIVLDDPQLRKRMGFSSKNKGRQLFKHLEELRNDLAHSQPILSRSWSEISTLVSQTNDFLERLEGM